MNNVDDIRLSSILYWYSTKGNQMIHVLPGCLAQHQSWEK